MGEWYRTGTVSVTNGSPNVVGVGTLWMSQASVGDVFLGPDLVEYEISSIADDTHLALKQINGTAAYAGTTNSAQVYAIIRNFTSTLPAQLASQLAALMTTYHVTLDELTAWLSGTGTVTVHDAVGNSYSVQTPAAMNAMLTGRLVKSVAGGADVTLTTAEAANLFIELTGTLTANINVILPAGVRHNFILNNTSGAYTVTIKTASGTGVAVTQGKRGLLECDGTNVVSALTALLGITAADLVNTPAGNLEATTVQAAINELDTEKAKLAGDSAQVFSVAEPASSAHAVSQGRMASEVNPRAIAQAIYLSAAASPSISIPYSASRELGASNFTIARTVALPDYTPSAQVYLFSARQDANNQIYFALKTDGKLILFSLIGGAAVINATSTVAVSGAAWETRKLGAVVTRESASAAGSVVFYQDGVQLGAAVAITAAATTAIAVNAAAELCGWASGARSESINVDAVVMNRALTAADMLTLSQSGVAFADSEAIQTNLVTAWTNDPTHPFETFTSSGADITSAINSAGFGIAYSNAFSLEAGKKYKFYVVAAGSDFSGDFRLGVNTAQYANGTNEGSLSVSAAGTFQLEYTASVSGTHYLSFRNVVSGTTVNCSLSGVTNKRIGATLYLPPEGIQPAQWLDASGNANNASFPASGAFLTRLMDRGMYRWTTPITGDTTLTSIVPAGFELDKIVFNNSTANAVSVRLGTTAGGVDVFGLTALNTSATLGGFKTLACNQAFSLTAAQTLYLSSTSWNSASLTATFYFRRVAP